VGGAIVVVPAVGYVFVLLSTVLGGPTIYSPFLPLPDPPPPAAVAAPHPQPLPTSSSTSAPTQPLVVNVASTQQPTATQHPGATVSLTPLTSLTSPTSGATAQAKGKPTALPATAQATGRPTALPTPTRRPVKSLR